MKPTTLVILMTLGAIMLAAVSACGTVGAASDSQHVTEAAAGIADFDLPAGFAPQFSAALSGYVVAAYQGPSAPSHLYLVQSQKESDGNDLQKTLAQVAPGSNDRNTHMTVIENRTATVRGQEVAVIISEGQNSDNITYRQLTVGFQGKGGPALLMFSDSAERWNQTTVDALLGSIH